MNVIFDEWFKRAMEHKPIVPSPACVAGAVALKPLPGKGKVRIVVNGRTDAG